MDKITLELSKDELGVICNALNEVCNGIEVWEFDTRMGIKMDQAKLFLESLALIYSKASKEGYDFEEDLE
jgi:hypothetical protein